MTYASLTPESPTEERVRDVLPEDDPAADDGPDVRVEPSGDELKRAQARRFDRMERERATDEGMVPAPPPEADEV